VGSARAVNVDVKVKGLDQLKREMQRLSAAVQTRLARNATMAMARVVPARRGSVARSVVSSASPPA
jgi:hypothetical protein